MDITLLHRLRKDKSRLKAALVLTAFALSMLTNSSNARAQVETLAASNSGEVSLLSPLDGMQFSAGITRDGEDQNSPLEDSLTFRDGKFSSLVCEQYNFVAAPYWIRLEGPRTHFLVELASPTDGTMVWRGTIENGTLEGTMRWKRERWYWTIDAEHTIRGELSAQR